MLKAMEASFINRKLRAIYGYLNFALLIIHQYPHVIILLRISVGNFVYPTLNFGPYGYNSQKGRFPVEQVNTVGLLLNPFRKKSPAERWSPVEIAGDICKVDLVSKALLTH